MASLKPDLSQPKQIETLVITDTDTYIDEPVDIYEITGKKEWYQVAVFGTGYPHTGGPESGGYTVVFNYMDEDDIIWSDKIGGGSRGYSIPNAKKQALECVQKHKAQRREHQTHPTTTVTSTGE